MDKPSIPTLLFLLFGLAAAPCLGQQAPTGMDDMADMDMSGMDMSAMGTMKMTGALGPYAMSREASGTSWQPESTPHQGLHFTAGDWMLMAHGYVDGIYDMQGGPRGGDKSFSSSMAMLMGQRPLGDEGTLALRSMISLEPLMGANGYPLLFATGETANGRTPLVDRQHPHNLFMELSATYSLKLSDDSATFLYAGLPGEPALGPPAFMHRASGMDNPEAPITHHWLDSTHITNGVVTAGYVQDRWKIEASAFNGREPDQYRYDINSPTLDSVSAQLSFNPTPNWSLQASWGYLKSPEQLTPTVHENRVTASASYNLPFDDNEWATTLAWGRKMNNPGHTLDGFLLESEVILAKTNTVFTRIERADEDELFEAPSPLAGQVSSPMEFTVGYIRDFELADHVTFGIGGLISRYAYPDRLNSAYGSDPTSGMVFVRIKLS
jgi:hypothetical protein